MTRVFFILSLLFLAACSNATPQITFLNPPTVTAPPVPQKQTLAFVEVTQAAGPQLVTAANAYSGKILVQSGTSVQAKTPDNYTLEIRSLSY